MANLDNEIIAAIANAEIAAGIDNEATLAQEQNAHREEGFYVPEVDELADVAGDFHHFVERFWL